MSRFDGEFWVVETFASGRVDQRFKRLVVRVVVWQAQQNRLHTQRSKVKGFVSTYEVTNIASCERTIQN